MNGWRLARFVALVQLLFAVGYGQTVYNVKNMGASGDGTTDDTAVIQQALNNCYSIGGNCKVQFPPGTYLSYALNASNTNNVLLEIQVGATLLAQGDTANWPGGTNPLPFISLDHVPNAKIYGGGVVNGNGPVWWKLVHSTGNKNYPRPRMFDIAHCDGIELYDVELIDSPSFHVYIEHSGHVHVHNITINAPGDSPNTDGIDLSSVYDSVVESCYIHTGDDCVALKSKHQGELTENIVVRNITCDRTMGLSVGGTVYAGVKNATFINCTMNRPFWGVRVKVSPHCQGFVRDILYKNIKLNQPATAISIRQDYENACTLQDGWDWRPRAAQIRNIRIEDVDITYDSTAEAPSQMGKFACDWANWCTVHMSNVQFHNVPPVFQDLKWGCSWVVGTQIGGDPDCECKGVFTHWYLGYAIVFAVLALIGICGTLMLAFGACVASWGSFIMQYKAKTASAEKRQADSSKSALSRAAELGVTQYAMGNAMLRSAPKVDYV